MKMYDVHITDRATKMPLIVVHDVFARSKSDARAIVTRQFTKGDRAYILSAKRRAYNNG